MRIPGRTRSRVFTTAVFLTVLAAALPAWADRYGECRHEDPARAIRGCTAIIEDRGESVQGVGSAYYGRALSHGALGNFKAAIADLGEAIARNYDLGESYSMRAVTYSLMGDYARALADTERAIEIAPGARAHRLYKAKLLQRLDRYQDSIATLDALLAREPGIAEAHYLIAYATLKTGDAMRAQREADYAVEIVPDNPHYRLMQATAQCRFASGDRVFMAGYWRELAVESFRKFWELRPELMIDLQRTLSALGYYAGAQHGKADPATIAAVEIYVKAGCPNPTP